MMSTDSSLTGRLVVGVDDETAAVAAVHWLARRAATTDEKVVVASATVHAIPSERLVEALESAHDALRRALGEERVEQRLITEAPSIVDALIEEADGDPLVIGHHRTRPLRSALAGWMPLEIVTRAEGPVFVIPDDAVVRGPEIVVGVSPDDSWRGAAMFAIDEARKTGGSVELVMAADHPALAHAFTMDDIVKDLQQDEVPLHGSVVAGQPWHVLPEAARRASLIVVGRHPGTPLAEILVGATDHTLMTDSRVPVCVVPPRQPQ
jgi:nucleotide-binding universal stress UspA family protein